MSKNLKTALPKIIALNETEDDDKENSVLEPAKAAPEGKMAYIRMIAQAIETLNEPKGASVAAVKAFIERTYNTTIAKQKLKKAFETGLATGVLTRPAGVDASKILIGRYKLNQRKTSLVLKKKPRKKVINKMPKKTASSDAQAVLASSTGQEKQKKTVDKKKSQTKARWGNAKTSKRDNKKEVNAEESDGPDDEVLAQGNKPNGRISSRQKPAEAAAAKSMSKKTAVVSRGKASPTESQIYEDESDGPDEVLALGNKHSGKIPSRQEPPEAAAAKPKYKKTALVSRGKASAAESQLDGAESDGPDGEVLALGNKANGQISSRQQKAPEAAKPKSKKTAVVSRGKASSAESQIDGDESDGSNDEVLSQGNKVIGDRGQISSRRQPTEAAAVKPTSKKIFSRGKASSTEAQMDVDGRKMRSKAVPETEPAGKVAKLQLVPCDPIEDSDDERISPTKDSNTEARSTGEGPAAIGKKVIAKPKKKTYRPGPKSKKHYLLENPESS